LRGPALLGAFAHRGVAGSLREPDVAPGAAGADIWGTQHFSSGGGNDTEAERAVPSGALGRRAVPGDQMLLEQVTFGELVAARFHRASISL
jgi:hypothetical protein